MQTKKNWPAPTANPSATSPSTTAPSVPAYMSARPAKERILVISTKWPNPNLAQPATSTWVWQMSSKNALTATKTSKIATQPAKLAKNKD